MDQISLTSASDALRPSRRPVASLARSLPQLESIPGLSAGRRNFSVQVVRNAPLRETHCVVFSHIADSAFRDRHLRRLLGDDLPSSSIRTELVPFFPVTIGWRSAPGDGSASGLWAVKAVTGVPTMGSRHMCYREGWPNISPTASGTTRPRPAAFAFFWKFASRQKGKGDRRPANDSMQCQRS